MTKPEVIARLQQLAKELGREIDLTGSQAELELRLREAEEELAALNDDDNIDGDGDGDGDGDKGKSDPKMNPGATPRIDTARMKGSLQVRVREKCLHLHVMTPRGRISKIVPPGESVSISPDDYDAKTMIKGG